MSISWGAKFRASSMITWTATCRFLDVLRGRNPKRQFPQSRLSWFSRRGFLFIERFVHAVGLDRSMDNTVQLEKIVLNLIAFAPVGVLIIAPKLAVTSFLYVRMPRNCKKIAGSSLWLSFAQEIWTFQQKMEDRQFHSGPNDLRHGHNSTLLATNDALILGSLRNFLKMDILNHRIDMQITYSRIQKSSALRLRVETVKISFQHLFDSF